MEQSLQQVGRFLVGGEEQEWSNYKDKAVELVRDPLPFDIPDPAQKWECRWCGANMSTPPQKASRMGRDTVVYTSHNDYLAPNTPFAMGQYCTAECQASMDSDVRQMLGPT